MKTGLWTALAMAVLCSTPVIALADWTPGGLNVDNRNNIFSSGEALGKARGNIDGTIVSVNYSGNTIVVSGAEGRQAIMILPTTSIFRNSGNASISDLAPGMRVTVSVSDINGALVAQIIRIH